MNHAASPKKSDEECGSRIVKLTFASEMTVEIYEK
jgi:hypothetical protein